MQTVRAKAFETNSSSTHTLTIDAANYVHREIPFQIHVVQDTEWNWRFSKFNDFASKAKYLMNRISACKTSAWGETAKKALEDITAESFGRITFEFDASNDYAEYDTCLSCKMPDPTKEHVWEFLTNTAVWVMTGNDNEFVSNWDQTPRQITALPYRVASITFSFSGSTIEALDKTKYTDEKMIIDQDLMHFDWGEDNTLDALDYLIHKTLRAEYPDSHYIIRSTGARHWNFSIDHEKAAAHLKEAVQRLSANNEYELVTFEYGYSSYDHKVQATVDESDKLTITVRVGIELNK